MDGIRQRCLINILKLHANQTSLDFLKQVRQLHEQNALKAQFGEAERQASAVAAVAAY